LAAFGECGEVVAVVDRRDDPDDAFVRVAGDVEVLAWGASFCRIGSANAAVLPVPVCAPAMRSRPASTSGMACSWTGEGFS